MGIKPKFIFLIVSLFFVCLVQAQSSNLPLVKINTSGQNIVDTPKITATMEIIFNGIGVRNNYADSGNNYTGKIGIEIRGKSSQQFPMKSYSVELRSDSGKSISKSLLSMPAQSDWILYAPYTDKTLMRNVIAYNLSNQMGWWAARCRHVELYINNAYVGVYVLLEKIKQDNNRVNISKLALKDTIGDALTGGYIFSIDKDANAWYSKYVPKNNKKNQTIQFSYIYPKVADIHAKQQDYIKKYVDSFETALASNNFTDTAIGYKKFINTASFIDYFLVNEISKNIDGYRLSTYFYKDKNSKDKRIVAGPVWDYDLAFRNADYCNASLTTGWSYLFNYQCENDFWLVPFWWEKFMEDTSFKAQLNCRYKQLRKTIFSDTKLFALIDSVASNLDEAKTRHFNKWPILGTYVWPNPKPIPNTYAEEISTLKNWLQQRLLWMDENIPNIGACYQYPSTANNLFSVKLVTNPISNYVNLLVQSSINSTLQVTLYNVLGQKIATQNLNFGIGRQNLYVNTTGLLGNTYLLLITEQKANFKTSFKIIKP